MSKLHVVHYPAEVLKKRAAAISDINGQIVEFIDEMFPAMYEAHGIGLAAPQVGVSQRIFVLDLQREESEPIICVNPEIADRHGVVVAEEGCLSLPNIYAEVERIEKLLLRYVDRDGTERELEAEGLLARAIQHEMDHLNGILLFERLTKEQRKVIADALQELREGRIPEPIER